MKKLSRYKMGIVVGLIAVIFTVIFVMYVVQPYHVKQEDLRTQIQDLEKSIQNEQNLQGNLEQVSSQHQQVSEVLNTIGNQSILGNVEYQALLSYIGDEATAKKVDVVQFESLPSESKETHWLIPYKISVQGDYVKLTKFINSLYKMKNYFRISKMYLGESDYIPMTDKVKNGDANLSNLETDWAKEFAEKLDRYLPTDMIVTEETQETEEENARKVIPTTIQLTFYMEFLTVSSPETTPPIPIELKTEAVETDENEQSVEEETTEESVVQENQDDSSKGGES